MNKMILSSGAIQKNSYIIHLKEVLYRVQKSGMKLNLAKCIFEATEITYLGHILSGDGIRADPKKYLQFVMCLLHVIKKTYSVSLV